MSWITSLTFSSVIYGQETVLCEKLCQSNTEKCETNLPLHISSKRQFQRCLPWRLSNNGVNRWVSPASDVSTHGQNSISLTGARAQNAVSWHLIPCHSKFLYWTPIKCSLTQSYDSFKFRLHSKLTGRNEARDPCKTLLTSPNFIFHMESKQLSHANGNRSVNSCCLLYTSPSPRD